MKRKRKYIPGDQEVHDFFESLNAITWEIRPLPNHRGRDISCLHSKFFNDLFIYMNKITGTYDLRAISSLFFYEEPNCIPSMSMDIIIGNGTEDDVKELIRQYDSTEYPQCLDIFQELFNKLAECKKQNKSCINIKLVEAL